MVEVKVEQISFAILLRVPFEKVYLHASIHFVLHFDSEIVSVLRLAQLAQTNDTLVDSLRQLVDGLEHAVTDEMNHQVADKDVDTGPDNKDGKPQFKDLCEKELLKLDGTLGNICLFEE